MADDVERVGIAGESDGGIRKVGLFARADGGGANLHGGIMQSRSPCGLHTGHSTEARRLAIAIDYQSPRECAPSAAVAQEVLRRSP